MTIKNTTPHESWEQQSLVAELERLEPGILMEINPAAGMKLDKRMAAAVKTLGYQAGTLDIFLPEHRVYIELKRQKGGSLSPEQKARIPRLEAAGYRVIVAKGAVDAINQLGKLGLFQLTLDMR
jgi:hypothetical protein